MLVLADSPEAGWRMDAPWTEQAGADSELLAAPQRESQGAGDTSVCANGEQG